MNTDQSTEKKAPDSESAVQVAPEHPLINVIMRQTDYSKELAVEKLKEHNNDVVSVVREYMNPPIQEVKNTKSTSQLIYGEIRSLMGSAATNYRIKKESEERKQQMQEIAIAKARALYEKQEAIKEQQIQHYKIQQQSLREKAAQQTQAQQTQAQQTQAQQTQTSANSSLPSTL